MPVLRVRRHSVLPVVLVGALLLGACTQDEPPTDTAEGVACQPEVATEAPTELDTSGDPPAELQVEQLAPPPADSCPEVADGDVVAVHYTGRSWSTGEVFDSSLERGPFTFELGAGRVIEGWDTGLAGLQVGERVRLTIPPELAYGEAGAPPAIGGNETLVFDVQVVEMLEQPTSSPSGAPASDTPT